MRLMILIYREINRFINFTVYRDRPIYDVSIVIPLQVFSRWTRTPFLGTVSRSLNPKEKKKAPMVRDFSDKIKAFISEVRTHSSEHRVLVVHQVLWVRRPPRHRAAWLWLSLCSQPATSNTPWLWPAPCLCPSLCGAAKAPELLRGTAAVANGWEKLFFFLRWELLFWVRQRHKVRSVRVRYAYFSFFFE